MFKSQVDRFLINKGIKGYGEQAGTSGTMAVTNSISSLLFIQGIDTKLVPPPPPPTPQTSKHIY